MLNDADDVVVWSLTWMLVYAWIVGTIYLVEGSVPPHAHVLSIFIGSTTARVWMLARSEEGEDG